MADFLDTYYLDIWEILLRLVLAAALGFAVGFDRTLKNKPLGFRPFMLVSSGSALFAMMVLELGLGPLTSSGIAQVDVSRVMQGVIGGIGMAVGFGLYVYALLAAVVAMVIFVVFGMLRAEIDANTEELDGKT